MSSAGSLDPVSLMGAKDKPEDRLGDNLESPVSFQVTALKSQVRDASRVNVFIDGRYRLSLDITQVASLGVKTGNRYSEDELAELENESQFGKLYTRSLEYALVRPRSNREMSDYLYRKTRDTLTKMGTLKKGASKELTERVMVRLVEKGYVDDEKFAKFWVENRNLRKGSSMRKLDSELRAKGVKAEVINEVIGNSERSDIEELRKVITKKAGRYDDERRLIAYLARQGFRYDDITEELRVDRD